MEHHVRWKSHAWCGAGEKAAIISKPYLSLYIPAEYFEMAGIDPGSKIEIYADDGVIEIREADEDTWKQNNPF